MSRVTRPAGEAEAAIVLDEPHAVSFLDIRPLFHGHTLLVPREHHVTLPDLPADQVEGYFSTAQRMATAIQQAMESTGTFVAMNNVVSQSVPHLHTHIVPRNPKDGLRGFFWPRTKYADEAEAASYAERIRSGLQAPAS